MRIETQQAPVPSQPEVVLSDGKFNLMLLYTFKKRKKQVHCLVLLFSKIFSSKFFFVLLHLSEKNVYYLENYLKTNS